MDASLNLEGRHPFCFRLDSAVIVIVNILGNRLGEGLKGGMWTKKAMTRRKNNRTRIHLAVPLCWLHWGKRPISRSLSNRSAAIMIRMVMPGERPPRPATPFPGQQAGVGTDSEQDGIQRHFEHWLLSAQDGAGRILSVSGSAAAAPYGISFAFERHKWLKCSLAKWLKYWLSHGGDSEWLQHV